MLTRYPVRMNQNDRRKTINSKGEIVEAPYGLGRWHSPRTYGCAHTDCANPATVLKTANAHTDTDTPANAHNCCGTH